MYIVKITRNNEKSYQKEFDTKDMANGYVDHLHEKLDEDFDFEIINLKDDSIDEDMEEDELDMMFPDEDSGEGFDWTLED